MAAAQRTDLRAEVPCAPGQTRRGGEIADQDRFIGALKTLQEKLGVLNDAWTAEQLAARLPRALRRALSNLHTAPESRHALATAERAMRRAMATAGYWQKVVD